MESDATSGLWELGVPNATFENGYPAQTGEDTTIDGQSCWITGNAAGENNPGQDDVDGGTTSLYSDVYDLSSFTDVLLTYNRWYTNNLGNSPGTDIWNVQVSSDGIFWVDLENTNLSNNNWIEQRFVLSEYIDLNSTIQFRFSASDLSYPGDSGSGGSFVEAAIDDFLLEAVSFDSIIGDINLDGQLDVLDIVNMINLILDTDNPSAEDLAIADLNFDSMLDVLDIVLLVNLILND